MITLIGTIRDIKDDLPKGRSKLFVFLQNYLYNARFRVLLNHRIGKYLFHCNNFILRQIALKYKYNLISKRGCDISYKSILGKGIKMPHPLGIVIGEGVIIKNNVMIFQQVTFGSHGKINESKKYPIIEDNVKIFAGAKIIGGITIGKNSIIGANSLVNIDVPENCIAYGTPCKIKKIV
ncbi:serine acetyltransferase [Empedobacter falsenii]